MLKAKLEEVQNKYFMDKVIDIFTNTNRFGKTFIRVNAYLPNEDITKTFNYTNKGLDQAIEFIAECRRKESSDL